MHVKDEETMLALASKLALVCEPPCTIYFRGVLGAGKTTFTRGFLKALGYEGRVKSPTYSLLEIYHLQDKEIVHIDLYRIKDPEELEHIGIRDLFHQNTIGLIEWPEMGEGKLPLPDIICSIALSDDQRIIEMQANSEHGATVLKLFSA